METTGFTEKESFETISRIIIAVLMVLQALVIGAAGIRTGEYSFFLMMPLALLFVSIGTLITGLVINEKAITASAIAGFIIPLLLLLDTVSGPCCPGTHHQLQDKP